MTNDLFFAPTLPRKLPSSVQCDQANSVSREPFSKTNSPDSSRDANHETFATTLRKASQDRNPSEGFRQPVSTVAGRAEKPNQPPVNKQGGDDAADRDDILNDILSMLGNDDTRPVADINQLIAFLEQLGFAASAEQGVSLSGGEGAVESMPGPADTALDSLAAFKQLLGAIQPNDQNPGNDMMSGLERLRQLIAQAMQGDSSVHNHGGSQDHPNSNQPLDSGQANAINVNGAMVAEGINGEKPVEIHPEPSPFATAAETVSTEPGSEKSGGNFQIPHPSERGDNPGTPRPNPDMRTAAEGDAATRDIKGQELMPGEAGDSNRTADISRLTASADRGPRSGGEPPVENSMTAESSPVSKLINGDLVEKESPLKADIAAGDDAGSKVVKLEAGANDSGQLNSQGQTFDKTLEAASAPKETEAAQREFRTRTMEQIVRQAVIQVKDGQHQARIDLKPEFMGHVRMQVITENHQVTVKILTEFGYVKDMIENNIQQLKADLQQQGLEVDKVDVSVSRDSQGGRHQQENTKQAENLHHEDKSSDDGQYPEGQQERPNRSHLRMESPATVDYFA